MKLAAATLMLAATSCGEEGKLDIRSTPTPFAAGRQMVSVRVAEANGQLALGNVALALEGYRKALREDPASLDALTGLAACYDQMGRFDLSRRYHEMALALAPGDARLYDNLAASLVVEGKSEEAAAVRKEMAQRFAVAAKPLKAAPVEAPSLAVTAAAVTPPVVARPEEPKQTMVTLRSVTPALVQSAPVPRPPLAQMPVAARSVTIALAPPRPVNPPAVMAASPRPARPAIALVRPGPRLERLSLGEVALVTSAAPLWRAQLVERGSRSATIGFRPLKSPAVRVASVVLLNAARSRGLAARTRTYLTARGWSRIAIGDAPKVVGASTIFYPAIRRATAVRLANQFGFALRHQRSETGTMTIMLGRDAAADGLLRARSG